MNLHPDLFLTFAGVRTGGPRPEILRQAEVNSA